MPTEPKNAKDIFLAAIELPAAERPAYLEEACADDPALRQRVAELIRAHEDSGSLLGEPGATPATIAQPSHAPPVLETTPPELPVIGVRAKDEPASAAQVGRRIANYELVELLGEGGMGTVWVARQNEPIKRTVALKLMKRGTDSKGMLARFEQERQALALMDHPNIARVIDGGLTGDGVPYFVMELVRGAPLIDFCDQHKLSARERLELFVPICQAVQHAHQKGIIHRDLKPANILVTLYDGRPTPKVIDFGVAKATGDKLIEATLSTQFGAIVGTLEYMSSEQAGLSGHDIDTRADVYSLGVILYELLTGLRPFDVKRLRRAALDEMFRVIREEEPPKPSTRLSTDDSVPSLAALRQTEPRRLVAQLRGELDCVVMKCLEKDRERRYETANGLARDIQRYLADDPVEARPPSTGYRLRKFASKNRMLLSTVAAFVVLLIAGATVSAMLAVRATRAEDAALLARDQEAAERVKAEAARERADSQAAIAQAISNFLQHDLLEQADLANQEAGTLGRDPDIKVKTLLDRASRSLDRKFQDQPLTEAALRLTLGRTYSSLLQFDEALRHMQRSIELRAATLGGDHPDTLTSRFHQALVTRLVEKFDKAETLEKEVLDKRLQVLGPTHEDTLTSQTELATLYYYQGRVDRAIPLLKAVLEQRTRQRAPDDPEILDLKNEMARYYQAQHDYEHAEPLFQDVVKLRVAKQGLDHPETFVSKHDLALTYLAEGKLDLAEPLLVEVLQGILALYGPDHPRTFHSKVFLAMLHREQRKFAQAESEFQEMIRIQTEKLGHDANDTLFTKRNLGLLYQAQGKYEQAGALYDEVLKKRASYLPATHAETGYNMQRLAVLYQVEGKYDQAEPLLIKALQAHRKQLGEENLRTLAGVQYLGRLYLAQGKYDQAEPLLREVLDKRLTQLGPDNEDTLSSKSDAARLLEARGRWTAAEPLRREVLTAQRRRFPEGHPMLARPLSDLGRNLLRQEKPAEAERVLREGLAASEKGQPDNWTTSNARSLLGASLLDQKRYAEAEPLLVQGYGELVQRKTLVPAEYRSATREALDRVIQLYEGMGKKDQATQWRKKVALLH